MSRPGPCSTCTGGRSRPPTRSWPGLSLDAPPARWPDYFSWRLRDVREIILHVITETAVHAGHLDAARELLDGRTWLGPEGTRIPPG
jgi:hypothetical protein